MNKRGNSDFFRDFSCMFGSSTLYHNMRDSTLSIVSECMVCSLELNDRFDANEPRWLNHNVER